MNKKMINKTLKNTVLLGFAPAIMLMSSQSMAVDLGSWGAGTGLDTNTTSTYYVDYDDPNSNYYYLNNATGLYQDVFGNTFDSTTEIITLYDGSTHDIYDAAVEGVANYFDYQMFIDDNYGAEAIPAFSEQSLNASASQDTTGTTTGGTTATSAGSVAYNADDITGTIQNIQNTAIAVMGAFITLGLTVMFYRKIRGLASRG